jgi:hypothetical protein
MEAAGFYGGESNVELVIELRSVSRMGFAIRGSARMRLGVDASKNSRVAWSVCLARSSLVWKDWLLNKRFQHSATRTHGGNRFLLAIQSSHTNNITA